MLGTDVQNLTLTDAEGKLSQGRLYWPHQLLLKERHQL